jgi:hypothetical protein
MNKLDRRAAAHRVAEAECELAVVEEKGAALGNTA